ncbi:MAG: adenylate/guanylate cyclase domain-containing protein [Methyloglobulus sp.]|nr:adenylate/guanylate cyclase domain-containing protein [Methyloglobulus sp.]
MINNRFSRALVIALVTAGVGYGIFYKTDLETARGLDALFKLRGSRTPPSEVVVVAMDEKSDTKLNLYSDLTEWRGFHTRLIQELQRQGAALIVFDLQFIASQPDHDPALAAAVASASNVLVTDCVQTPTSARDQCSKANKKTFSNTENGNQPAPSKSSIEWKRIPLNRMLRSAVLDHAPFLLSNDAENTVVREVWTFFNGLVEAPSLPVLTWFYYLQRSGALNGIALPKHLSLWLAEQRMQCPTSARQLKNSGLMEDNLTESIEEVLCSDDTRHLDFYGPPKTFRMESYSDVYEGKVGNLSGKVVFVGKVYRNDLSNREDNFDTPLMTTQTGRMSGVEIMATQFANLLEGRLITVPAWHSLILLVFCLLVGLVLTQFAGFTGIIISALLSGAYVGLAVWCFSSYGAWLPIAVPILIQLPLAWLIALLWSRRDLLKERKCILAFVHRVFPQWMPIPTSSKEWFPEINDETQARSERDVLGICLATDIEGYTTVAAQHTAHEMWELLNAYYQVLGYPVASHKGIIADVTGDAMMAVWIDLPAAKKRLGACLAALEMALAVEKFNETATTGCCLPTRIGLHEGDMTLGRLDAGEGSHYRAIGDTVSTASRIQGVNKYLGTRILASSGVVTGLDDVVYRPVGRFRLIGRAEPIELMEIVGLKADIDMTVYTLHQQFALGLNAFEQGQWEVAASHFQILLNQYGDDAPSLFYLAIALKYTKNPPADWEGVVTLTGK